MVHLERNLISISLKEQLLARPAIEDLEKQGIKPRDGSKVRSLGFCSDFTRVFRLAPQTRTID